YGTKLLRLKHALWTSLFNLVVSPILKTAFESPKNSAQAMLGPVWEPDYHKKSPLKRLNYPLQYIGVGTVSAWPARQTFILLPLRNRGIRLSAGGAMVVVVSLMVVLLSIVLG